jgi:filamin
MKKPPVDAKRCYATGRGIQPRGIRVGDDADFKVTPREPARVT